MYLSALAGCFGIIVAIPLLHLGVSISVPLWMSGVLLCLLLLLGAAIKNHQVIIYSVLLPLAMTLAAISYGQASLQQRLAERLLQTQTLSVAVRVIGLSDSVDSTWRQVVQPVEPRVNLPSRWLLGLPYAPDPQAASIAPSMRAGEIWQVTVTLSPVRGRASRGVFDLERWLILERGIGAQAELVTAQRLNRPVKLSLIERVDRLRLQLREHFQTFTPDSRGVLLGLLTGDRALISDQDQQLYQQAGIAHLLAISGPHVLLAAAALTWAFGLILNCFPRLYLRMERPRWLLPIFVLAVIGYALLAGWQLPAQRTVIMTVLVAGLAWWRLRWPSFKLLSVAAAILLLFDPLAVLSAGFWLSFGAVWVLLWLARRASDTGDDLPFSHRVWLRLKQFVTLQWMITLGLLPLVLAVFGQFSWVAIPVNLVAIPLLSFVVLGLNLLGLLFWPFFPILADQVWQWDLWILQQFHQALHLLLDGRPYLVWQYRLSGVSLVAGLLLVLVWLIPRRVLPLGVSGFLLLPLFYPNHEQAALQVRVLDVGQGLSVLLQTPNHQMLFDTGTASAAQRVVLPTLSAYGVKSLDRLLLSVPDHQQMGGMQAVTERLKVQQVSASFEDTQIKIQPCAAGQSWTWDGVLFEMLAPWPEVTQMDRRELSCLLRVTTAPNALGQRHRVLVMGGAGQLTEQMLRLLCAELQADVLVLGRGKAANSVDFVQAVQPRYAVWSAARLKPNEQQKIEGIKQLAIQVDQTGLEGTLSYQLGGDVIVRQAWRDERVWLR